MDDKNLQKLQTMINQNSNIVFFGGAGVSTESGIPDFRSAEGILYQSYTFAPEQVISHSFFWQHPDIFFDFYRTKMMFLDALPNPAHQKLAELEQNGKLKAIVTQNIDGLHQAAGSQNVYELHGSIHRNYCTICRQFYEPAYVKNSTGVPICTCGGIIKPDVVLYEEGLNDEVISRSIQTISQADMLIIGGTSLVVYPAAGFIDYFNGRHLVVINKSSTSRTVKADLSINEAIGEVFAGIKV